MRTGVRLGVDVGEVRVGVARSDPSGMLAFPSETIDVPRAGSGADSATDSGGASGPVVARLVVLAREYDVLEVVVGLPRVLSGGEGVAAHKARAFAADLAVALASGPSGAGGRVRPVPVRLVDERLSTSAALAGFRAGGVSTRKSRRRVDQAAAALILQSALDAERCSGTAPGEIVEAELP